MLARAVAMTMLFLTNGVPVLSDFDCLCSYNIERAVYPAPSLQSSPIGYLYEFDCKQIFLTQTESDWFKIAFEHKIGYVEVGAQTAVQRCQGEPAAADKLTTVHSPVKTSPSLPVSSHVKSTVTVSPGIMTSGLTTPTTKQTTLAIISTQTPTTTLPSPEKTTAAPSFTPTTTATITTTPTTTKSSTITTPTTTTTAATSKQTTLQTTKPTQVITKTSTTKTPAKSTIALTTSIPTTMTMTTTRTTKTTFPSTSSTPTTTTTPTTKTTSTTTTAPTTTYILSTSSLPTTTTTPTTKTTTTMTKTTSTTTTPTTTSTFTTTLTPTTTRTTPTSTRTTPTTTTTTTTTPTTMTQTTTTTTTTTLPTTTTSTEPPVTGEIRICPDALTQFAMQDLGALTQYGEYCYELVPTKLIWTKAEHDCKAKGGHLIHIYGRGLQYFLYDWLISFGFYESIWIGLHNMTLADSFQWISGQHLSYTNWFPARIKLDGGQCAKMVPSSPYFGMWTEADCGKSVPTGDIGEINAFICEYNIKSHHLTAESAVFVG